MISLSIFSHSRILKLVPTWIALLHLCKSDYLVCTVLFSSLRASMEGYLDSYDPVISATPAGIFVNRVEVRNLFLNFWRDKGFHPFMTDAHNRLYAYVSSFVFYQVTLLPSYFSFIMCRWSAYVWAFFWIVRLMWCYYDINFV